MSDGKVALTDNVHPDKYINLQDAEGNGEVGDNQLVREFDVHQERRNVFSSSLSMVDSSRSRRLEAMRIHYSLTDYALSRAGVPQCPDIHSASGVAVLKDHTVIRQRRHQTIVIGREAAGRLGAGYFGNTTRE